MQKFCMFTNLPKSIFTKELGYRNLYLAHMKQIQSAKILLFKLVAAAILATKNEIDCRPLLLNRRQAREISPA